MRKAKAQPIWPSLQSLRFIEAMGKLIHGKKYDSVRALAIDMPYAVSFVFRHLNKMEQLYGGVELLNRCSVQLTKDGERLYKSAVEAIQAHARCQQWPFQEREEVTIGTNNRSLNFVLPAIIAAYFERRAERLRNETERHPVDLRFREYDFEQMIDDLRRGDIDAGICGLPFSGQWLDVSHEVVWKDVATVMIASSKHPWWGQAARDDGRDKVDLNELASEAVCVVERDLYGVLATLPRPKAGGSRIAVDLYSSVVAIVRSGAAVGFVPQFDDRIEPSPSQEPGLVSYEIAGSKLALRDLAIWWRTGEKLSLAVDDFLCVVRKELKRGVAARR